MKKPNRLGWRAARRKFGLIICLASLLVGPAIPQGASKPAGLEYSGHGFVDSRKPIADTEKYPWACICKIKATFSDASVVEGTGCVIGVKLVLTAGHMMFLKDKGWAVSWTVIPGYSDGKEPFGEFICNTNEDHYQSWTTWINNGDPNWDIGYLVVHPKTSGSLDIGKRVGYLGFDDETTDNLNKLNVHVCGYPMDKPEDEPLKQGELMYYCNGIFDKVEDQSLKYTFATAKGMSGSPIIRVTIDRIDDLSTWKYYVIGVHTRGDESGNQGVRLTDGLHKWLHEARVNNP